MAGAGSVITLTSDMGIDGLRAIPRKFVNDTRKQHPERFSMYMRKISSNEFMEQYEELGGFGDIPRRDEGDFMNFAKMDVGNITRIQPDTYQLAFAITEKARRFNKMNIVQRASQKLAIAARRTYEKIAAAPFNEGFSATVRLGTDGQPLFSTAHVRLNGATASNKASADLTTATLEAALVAFSLQTDQDGTYIDLTPKYLVVHPNEAPNAMRILRSQNYPQMTAGVPNAADTGVPNDFIRNYNLILVINPYLTDTDAWFLLADKDEHEVIVVENEKFNDDSFIDPYTKDFVYSVQFSAIAAHATDIGAYGSEGAG